MKRDISFSNLRTSATGSISNLLAVTPLNDPPKKQSKVTECTDIFTPLKNEIKGKRLLKNASFLGEICKEEDRKST